MNELTPEEMTQVSGGAQAMISQSPFQQLVGIIEDLFRMLGGDPGSDGRRLARLN